MTLLGALVALILFWQVAKAVEVTHDPRAPWAGRKLTFSKGLPPFLGFALLGWLFIRGARAVFEGRVGDAWVWLPFCLPFGLLAGAWGLRTTRQDLFGRPWLDAILVGLPLGLLGWVTAVGFQDIRLIGAAVFWSAVVVAGALYVLAPRKEG